MNPRNKILRLSTMLTKAVEDYQFKPRIYERGIVRSVSDEIAEVHGLHSASYYELVTLAGGVRGVVIDIEKEKLMVLILERTGDLKVGTHVYRTGRTASIPVSEEVLGRMINPMGDPLDLHGPYRAAEDYPVEREAPPLFERDFVTEQLSTGIKVIDAMFPIGKGQRELILGDPSTGKTSIAIDTILNQKSKNVICVYVAIGQRKQAIHDVYSILKEKGAMPYTVIVASSSEDPAGLQFMAPYAGTAVAEYFLDRGRDVLIVYDDLTKHAFAYQTISLLLKRPPGREAFPGDIFYIHSRLLERACKFKKGGSITALPIVETQAGRIESYIPTNLISITDGQIYLDSGLFNMNQRPAVDVGRSVSRIGGKTQIPAFKEVAESLRLYYAQFLELEVFTKLGVEVFGETKTVIERGLRLRELLKQERFRHYQIEEQTVIFFLFVKGFFDSIEPSEVKDVADGILETIRRRDPAILDEIGKGKYLTQELKERIMKGADLHGIS